MTSTHVDRAALVRRILELQDRDGRISWFDVGIFDPWNHAESAMGLAIGGELDAARSALAHLRETQLPDGSWEGDMGCAAPLDADNRFVLADNVPTIRDTNFCAYPAVAAWHLALMSGERRDISENAAMITRAMTWVLDHQRTDGAFAWRACDAGENVEDVDALRTGSASIYLSLECAIRSLGEIGRPTEPLTAARERLGRTLRLSPESTWLDKRSFAMDWYYPVLCGALGHRAACTGAVLPLIGASSCTPNGAAAALTDEPWVTAAETAELAIASARVGADARGATPAWRCWSTASTP